MLEVVEGLKLRMVHEARRPFDGEEKAILNGCMAGIFLINRLGVHQTGFALYALPQSQPLPLQLQIVAQARGACDDAGADHSGHDAPAGVCGHQRQKVLASRGLRFKTSGGLGVKRFKRHAV